MKNSLLDDFPLFPQPPPPLKTENFIFIVVSPSLRCGFSGPVFPLCKLFRCMHLMEQAGQLCEGRTCLDALHSKEESIYARKAAPCYCAPPTSCGLVWAPRMWPMLLAENPPFFPMVSFDIVLWVTLGPPLKRNLPFSGVL